MSINLDEMLKAIHKAWNDVDSSTETLVALWAESDGYGEQGYVPEQGYDWSGIRDSSEGAIRSMWERLQELTKPKEENN
jgi:hypothetical protein